MRWGLVGSLALPGGIATRLVALCLGAVLLACAPGEAVPPGVSSYCGMCDASAIVALDEDHFVAADDEDSALRIYSRERAGLPVQRFDLRGFLGLDANDEADLEASARAGDRIYWITSHGNNRKGKEQSSRQRFFAMRVEPDGTAPRLSEEGKPYTQLLDDLIAAPELREFNLAASLNLPPKTPGALNIEGLAATPDGHLLLGFRNPVPRGKALIVPLINPGDVIRGERARFGQPRQIDLGGHGIRSIERWKNGYLLIAGSIDGKGDSTLFWWTGDDAKPRQLSEVDLKGINPEAIAVVERGGLFELLVASDDGTRKVNGVDCKQLKDPLQKSFRAALLPLPADAALQP